jgi:hypothetical protein
MVWLGRTAKRGLADLPRNVLWALDAGVAGPARSAGHSVQAAGQRAATAVADVNPFGDGVDRRSNRVDSAMERVHELELRAHDAARDAKERADAARAAEEEGDRQVEAARRDGEREVAQVVAESQREADDYVAAKRAQAEQVSARRVAETEEQVRRRVEQAEEQAELARSRAEQAIEQARREMAKARELAEEAAVAARAAADEARARAERLADQAEEEAERARRRVDDADARREAAVTEGRRLGADADTDPLDLDDMTKEKLLALGREMGLELSSSMRKHEVVSAIRKHADEHDQEARAS